jgi:subtilisin family serine protease
MRSTLSSFVLIASVSQMCFYSQAALAQPVDPVALAELQQRRNVAPRVIQRFAEGAPSIQIEFVLKGYEVDPPFYRPVIDDTPARRRWARDRLRAHMGSLMNPNVVSGNVDRGALRFPATLAAARRLAASGFVHSVTTIDGSYQQATSLSDVLLTVNVVPELSQQGLNGSGIRVALIDNDFQAAILGSVVVQEECFCRASCCANGQARMSGPGASNIPGIDDGHGTEVASEIAFQSGAQGTAPAAGLVLLAFDAVVDIYDALDWLATQAQVGVLSLSILTATAPGTFDSNPLAASWLPRIAALDAQNKVVVAASGNFESRTSIAIPACLSQVTAVAGTWACTWIKPQKPQPQDGCDLGAEFDALWPGSSTSLKIDTLAPAKPLQVPYLAPPGAPTYTFGTSNAAPVVAGCAALLRQAFPNATGAAIRDALRVSPTSVSIDDGSGKDFARGRLDCNAAFQALQGTQGPPGINLNQHGLSGLWYDPSKPGQGFSFEVFPDQFGPGQGNFTGGWFTFAPGLPGGPERSAGSHSEAK